MDPGMPKPDQEIHCTEQIMPRDTNWKRAFDDSHIFIEYKAIIFNWPPQTTDF